MATFRLTVRGLHRGEVEIDASSTVGALRSSIAALAGAPAAELKLLSGGKALIDDGRALSEYGVSPQRTIMVMRTESASAVADAAS